MPSLLGTTVAANYGRMTAQQTYGSGNIYSNFGTRQLRFVKVAITSATNADLSKGADGQTGTYTESLSMFATAIRGIQQFAEIYFVGVPTSAGFVIAVSDDTDNDNDKNNGNVSNAGNGLIEDAVQQAIAAYAGSSATATATTLTASGITIA